MTTPTPLYTRDTDRLIKWKIVDREARTRVAERLKKISTSDIVCIPTLFSFGWTENRLRLETEFVPGTSLSLLSIKDEASFASKLAGPLFACLRQWQRSGFVHGDLSPSNIIVEMKKDKITQIHCIDWTLDLEGFEATPRYAAPEVYEGIRDCRTDEYAVQLILNSFYE